MEKISPYYEALIIRFFQKEISDDDLKILRQWLEEDEAHRKHFREVNDTLQISITMNRINQQKIDTAWKNISNKITPRPSLKNSFLMSGRVFLRLAATISAIVILGVSGWIYFTSPVQTLQHAVIHNTNKWNTHITLPDGTSVWLNANSTLQYDQHFGTSSREVKLDGEAFFDVTKHHKDFVVKTDDVSVLVKGTRFNIRAYPGEQDVKTTLEEGSVQLQVKGDIYAMAPGEQITVTTSLNKISRHTVDPSDFTSWKEDKLIFDDVPLSQILLKIENRYNVIISIDDKLAQRERLTMTIENETIDEILEAIHLSSHLKYKKEKNKISIYE